MVAKRLNKKYFDVASDFLLHSARALERNTYNHFFNGENLDEPLIELRNYQNPDGGFGHGLEPDFRLPYSSPIATVVAFRHLEEIGDNSNLARGIIESGLSYFEDSFRQDAGRWFAVPEEINEYPHAPWWHFDESTGKTTIDESWGNPTAEILAYGLKYDGFSKNIDTERLISDAIRNFQKKDKFESEHEVYCYIKLQEVLPSDLAGIIRTHLARAAEKLVCTEPSRWNEYLPKPLDFIGGPESPRFGISESLLEKNLDFLVEKIEEEGKVEPSWNWEQFESEWERAKLELTGVLTLNALVTLKRFNRIDLEGKD